MEAKTFYLLMDDDNIYSWSSKAIHSVCTSAEIKQFSDWEFLLDSVHKNKPDFVLLAYKEITDLQKKYLKKLFFLTDSVPILLVVNNTTALKQAKTLISSELIDGVIKAETCIYRFKSILKLLLFVKQKRVCSLDFSIIDLINVNANDVLHKDCITNVFNFTNEGLWYWDVKNNVIILSQKFRKVLGYDLSSLPNDAEAFTNLIHPEDKIHFRQAVVDFIDRVNDNFSMELRLQCADKSYKWMLYRGYGIEADDDKVSILVGIQSDIDSLRSKITMFQNMALYDSLTNLPNRTLLYDRLTRAIVVSDRNKKKLGLLFIDLNKFKAVNDKFGHKVGDLVLIETAKRLSNAIRKIDSVARLSGDEFVVLTPNLNNNDDIQVVISRINEEFAQPMHFEGHEIHQTCSIGYSIYPKDGNDIDSLLESADKAMYKRKNILKKLTQTSN